MVDLSIHYIIDPMPQDTTSRIIIGSICGFGLLILLLSSFAVGVAVGERKARHFSGWTQQYGRRFNLPVRGPGPLPFGSPMMPMGSGVFGKIVSVSEQGLVVQGKDGVEQAVTVSSSTSIRVGRDEAKLQDLQAGTEAAVFGEPNDAGPIDARLIRVF